MDWMLKPKNTRLLVLIGFIGNAIFLAYNILKDSNPANPLAPLDRLMGTPGLILGTICLGIAYVYLLLNKDKLEKQHNQQMKADEK